METMKFSLIRILFALVIGLVLVLWPGVAATYIVITLGVAFFVPGVVSLIGYFTRQKSTENPSGTPADEPSHRFPVEGVGSLLLGLWLMVMPDFFAEILVYLLGFVLLLGGVQQIASLMAARRWMPVPAAYYVVPTLILVAGLVALFNPWGVIATAFTIIGASLLVYAVFELVNWFKFARRKPRPVPGPEEDDVEDATLID
ncbi:MAG: DUF308 domain-containing protein [Mediterranea sp.]|jgi:uncharacterized membrane protein HdeD (DUF308 family)|nr:DUF308 domain-containing protein [Mediterranea sp.]